MRFSDIIGHSELKEALARSAAEGRVSHAQLFCGKSSNGALALSLAYAQYLNCTDRQNNDSCGKCPSCVKMSSLIHPDLHFVYPIYGGTSQKKLTSDAFAAQWREMWIQNDGIFDQPMWNEAMGIENQQTLISRNEAEDIIRKLSFKSFEGRYKIMIIWLPEKMNPQASNALLKILEEPWEHTLFLLVSEAPALLLDTIRSRTQQVTIGDLTADQITAYIDAKFGTDISTARNISLNSAGDLLEAIRYARGEGNESNEAYFENFVELMRFSYNDRHMELLEWADSMSSIGRERQRNFFEYSISLLRSSYMLHAGMNDIAYLHGEELDFCLKFSPFIGNNNIEALTEEFELAKKQILQNGNAKIVLSHFSLKVSKMINRLK